MTSVRLKRFLYFAVFTVICLFLMLLQSSGLATFNIGKASVIWALPFTVLAGFYFKGYYGIAFGFFMGSLTDVYSSTVCYNIIALSVIGFVSGMLVDYLFNANLASIIVLQVSASALYFFVKWLVVFLPIDQAAGYVLWNYMLPSAIYGTVLGVLLYYAFNPFYKRMPVPVKNIKYE